MKPQVYAGRVAAALTLLAGPIHLSPCHGQSADWQSLIWREPQVRYLLADMTGGGKVEMYRKYALEERDPDSREALRLWDAGVRAVNMADFERRWITNKVAKDGRAFRVVLRGTDRTISGNVRRIEEGFRVTNTELFERKQVDGKTLITRKGFTLRISGSEVKLSSD